MPKVGDIVRCARHLRAGAEDPFIGRVSRIDGGCVAVRNLRGIELVCFSEEVEVLRKSELVCFSEEVEVLRKSWEGGERGSTGRFRRKEADRVRPMDVVEIDVGEKSVCRRCDGWRRL